MFLAILPERVCRPCRERLRLPLFLPKKWFRLALPTRTLPFLLTRTRSLVPLWVLSLGISGSFWGWLGYNFFAAGADDEAELAPGQLRLLIDYYYITETLDNAPGN